MLGSDQYGSVLYVLSTVPVYSPARYTVYGITRLYIQVCVNYINIIKCTGTYVPDLAHLYITVPVPVPGHILMVYLNIIGIYW